MPLRLAPVTFAIAHRRRNPPPVALALAELAKVHLAPLTVVA